MGRKWNDSAASPGGETLRRQLLWWRKKMRRGGRRKLRGGPSSRRWVPSWCCYYYFVSKSVVISVFSTNSTFSLRVRQEAAGGFAQSAVKMSEKARRSWRELSDQGGAKNNVWPVRSMLQPHLLD
mmetsp:Transcript_14713/g.20857  ORF Transcript_14713/g.20857 Transcript_14713/m.20857 type:complete len:125 (-) Transcript_14713:103-477(-)